MKGALRNARVILPHLPWLALLGWLASVSWFLTDDAFISFRYARNLLEGHGLVFNPGEYVEGYSNFLWVLELAAIWGLSGVAPEHAAPWLSVAFTAGTIAATMWWIARLPALRHRGLVAWMTLGFMCSSATFAVWTSGGGLETRQFTFFIVLAVMCLSLYRDGRRGLLAASLSLAAAALTRPEGPLLAALCFGWFVIQRMADTGRPQPDWRRLAWLAAPFVVLICTHFLWRYAYYGEWLPNTYYAKHVRPWYESGFRYLWTAAIETGLYLLIPLAAVAMRNRWRASRDGIFALMLLLVGVHMAYVMRIGGDHFEYRPLDFYWPLLAVPASMGITHLGARIAGCRLMREFSLRLAVGRRTCAIALFVPVLFYGSAIQGTLLFEGEAIREHTHRMFIKLDDSNNRWLLAAPVMPMLVAISNDLRRQTVPHSVATPSAQHRKSASIWLRNWKPYENIDRGVIPDDALALGYALGIQSYYLPDLKVIDRYGLTDATVARNPVTRPNLQRRMAHDRRPPPGYLEERGVNFAIYPLAYSECQVFVFMRAEYVVKIGPALWMPFDSPDRQWVLDRFAGQDLRILGHSPTTDPSCYRWHKSGYFYQGEWILASFEDGFDGWILEGEAITNHGQHKHYKGQHPIFYNVGPGFLTSYHPEKGGRAFGRALSPAFTAESDQYLAFLIAGGMGRGVGLRLLVDGEEAMVWRSRNTERFEQVVHSLAEVAGRRLQLELFDDETAAGGHIMIDHVMLVHRQSEEP